MVVVIVLVFRVLSMRDSWWASLRSLWLLVTIFAFLVVAGDHRIGIVGLSLTLYFSQ